MRDLGQRPAERETLSGRSWKNTPTIAARIAAPLPADMTPLGEMPKSNADARPHCRQADSPWQAAEPSEQCTPKCADAGVRITRMPGQALRNQGRLLGVVRHEAGPPQQPEPIHRPEASGDRTCRHAFARKAQSVSQRDTQSVPASRSADGSTRSRRNRGLFRSLQLPQKLEKLRVKRRRVAHIRRMAAAGNDHFPAVVAHSSPAGRPATSGIKRSCSPQMARTGALICLSRS